MTETMLKTAVIGLNDSGQSLLEAAQNSGFFQIQAVADKNTELAKKTGAKYNCSSYDDYRQLIIQNQFDCLIVAASLHTCEEYILMGMKKKFNILKTAPPARNFEQAVQFFRLAESEKIKFSIVSPVRFAKSYQTVYQYLYPENLENQENKIEPYLGFAYCMLSKEKFENWQTDPKLAGGGVLLYDSFEMIDRIISLFGLPMTVYALATSTVGDKQQRLYTTEDSAMVTMKFSDFFYLNFVVNNNSSQKENLLRIQGKNLNFVLSDDKLIFKDQEQKNKIKKFDDTSEALSNLLLTNFALSILSPQTNKLITDIKDNLKMLAVIESAYLSIKTGVPENPEKILKIHDVFF